MQMSGPPKRTFPLRYTSPQPQRRRTFARLTAFDVACPECGTVDCVKHGRPWWKRKTNFNPWLSRWRCRSCRRVFAVGVVFWPVTRAGNRPRERRPVDTIPTKRELYGLREIVDRGWTEPVNLACECLGDDTGNCPLHGENWE